MVTEATLNKISSMLKEAGCSEVYLFGSQATGRAHENSDIDIGVKGLEPSKFCRMQWKLEDTADMHVDLVDFDFQSDFYKLLDGIGELRKIG